MPACECCGDDAATPLYLMETRGQVMRQELGLMPDAALCASCRGVVEWTLRHTWMVQGRRETRRRFDEGEQ